MKRLVFVIPVILFALIAAALIGPSFIDWNSYKPQIQQEVKKQANVELVLDGPLKLSLLPYPRLTAETLRVVPETPSKYENLLVLKRVDVGLDLLPLLSGRISVSSVTLVEPKIFVEVMQDGKINGMPADESQEGALAAVPSTSSMAPAISFDHIKIEDASFAYYDQKTKVETMLDDVSGELSAQSLYGPYKGEGSFLYQGKIMNFDVTSQAFNAETKILPAQVHMVVQPGNIDVKFAGALSFAEDFAAQGQVEVMLEDLRKTLIANNVAQDNAMLEGSLNIKGFLSADSKKAEIKTLEVNVAGQKISGMMSAIFEPFAITASLKTMDKLDLQKFLKGYPEIKNGAFDLALVGDAQSVNVSKGKVWINEDAYQVDAQYVFANKTGRPELNLDLGGKNVNTDLFYPKKEIVKNDVKSVFYGAVLKPSYETNLPLDLHYNVAFDSIVYDGEVIKKVKVQGDVAQNRVKVTSLTVGDFKGSEVNFTGEIKDTKAMTGMSLAGSVITQDAKSLAAYFGVELGDMPKDVNAGSLKFKASGEMKALDSLINISAAHGDMIAQGIIKDALGKPQVERLTVQVKHRNMAEAMQIFAKFEEKDPQFSKPMDFFANVQQVKDGSYTLSGIKADLAGILLQGEAQLQLADAKPFLKGDLKFENLKLSGGGQSFTQGNKNAAASDAASKMKGSAPRWSKEPIDLSGLNAFNADVNISAKSISSDPWVFTNAKTNIILQDGTLSIKDFAGGLFGGTVAFDSTIETASQPRQPLHISVAAGMKQVDSGTMLRALTGGNLVKASGDINMDVNIKTSGLSTAALVYDLNGSGNLNGSDIVLDGIDVERFAVALSEESKPGDTVMGIWKGASKGGSTSFETLDGTFVITEGIVAIQKLDLDGPQASIFTTGKVDLPNWTITTKHKLTAKTREDVPPFDMAFSGPLDNPAQTFGQGVLNDYLQRKVSRKVNKLLTDKLGDKLGLPLGTITQQEDPIPQNPNDITPAADDQQTAPSQETQQNEEEQPEPQKLEDMKPEDAIKDVLKGLLQ